MPLVVIYILANWAGMPVVVIYILANWAGNKPALPASLPYNYREKYSLILYF